MFSFIQIAKYRNNYRYVFIHWLVYRHIFPGSVCCKGLEAMNISQIHSWFLIPFSNKRNQKQEQGIHKMSLDRTVVSKNKKVHKKKYPMEYFKGMQEPTERAPNS